MDKVIIQDLLVRGIIGINDWERKRAQDILINITLFTDTRRAADTDNITDCVNYSTMSKRIQAHAESAERLARLESSRPREVREGKRRPEPRVQRFGYASPLARYAEAPRLV